MIVLKFIIPKKICDKIDSALHTTIIPLPNSIKCAIQINEDDLYCYNKKTKLNKSSQENANIDLYGVGHFIQWFLVGWLSDISCQKVLILSILWEVCEYLLGKYGFKYNARITDVFVNMSGLMLGKYAQNIKI